MNICDDELKILYAFYISQKFSFTTYDDNTWKLQKMGYGECRGGFDNQFYWNEKALMLLPVDKLQKLCEECEIIRKNYKHGSDQILNILSTI